MRTVTRIRPLIVEMPTWSVEVARARPFGKNATANEGRVSALPIRAEICAAGAPRVGDASKRSRAGRTRREEAPDDVLSVLPLDEGGAREQLPEMQHLHAQVTLDRARHGRAACAPAGAIYGMTLGTLAQYSATPGTQVAGGTKH